MSDMKTLLESITKFSGEPKQKVGDQVKGTEEATSNKKDHPFKDRLVGENLELEESLMTEYYHFVKEVTGNVAADNMASPVANVNPAGTGTGMQQTAQPTQPGQPQQQTGQPQQQQTGQPQQAQQPTPQEIQKAKQDLTANVNQLKSVNPNIDPTKVAAALSKDPNTQSPADKEALGQIGAALAPALKDKAAMGSLKSAIQKVS
jgi:hypothetical protein